MKRTAKLISVVMALCLFFLGCPAGKPALAEDTGAAGHRPASTIPVLREMIAESDRTMEEMAQLGYYALPTELVAVLVEPAEPYAPTGESAPVREGSVDLTVAARIEERENDGSTAFSVAALLTVNGRMVDFELDGSRSTDGLLLTTLQSNRDYLLPLHAEQLPAEEGGNEIMLVLMGCCPEQALYLDAQYLTCHFNADRAAEGAVVLPCPEERMDRVVTIRDRKDAPELMMKPTVAPGEQLGFESDHRGHVLIRTKPSPTLHFYIDNMSMDDLSRQRTGLMAFSVDGILQPVWDGQLIGEVRLQEDDLMKVVQLKTDFASGERHSICWYYFDTVSAGEWKTWDRICVTVEVR